MAEGFCHVMTVEWIVTVLRGRTWNEHVEGFRAVARSRGYTERHDFPSAADYDALDVDTQYVEEVVRSSRPLRSRRIWRSPGHLLVYRNCEHLEPGSGLVLRIESPDGNHTIGLLRSADGTFRFLDVNEGRYHWPAGTTGLTVSFDVRGYVATQNPSRLDACWIGPAALLSNVI